MQTKVTYCRICEAACGMLADVEGDRLVALRPDRDHVVSQGFACAKGTRFAEVHRSPGRLDHPERRGPDGMARIGWNEATREIGEKLARIRREHGPHSVGVYIGNPAAFSYTLPVYGMAFVQALGTRNYFSAGSLDCNNKFIVARHMLGSAGTHPVPDLDRARFALLVGTNPSVSQSSFVNAPRMIARLKGIEARGGRVVVVDPRKSETAQVVGEHVAIAPDTDAAFLLALLHVIFAEDLFDSAMLEGHASGVAELRRAVERFSPERVAAATRVAPDTIRDIARGFAHADGAFCHVSTGVNQGRFGNIAYAAKIALELVSGNLDRAGGALMIRGATDTAGLARLIGLDREPKWKSRIGGFSPVLGTLPTPILADEILTPGPEQIRALVVVAGNPVLSAPDGDRLGRALDQLELCVSVDLFVNDTGAHATHLLPATDWLEREDFPLAQLQLQPNPYVQWTDAVVPARGERRQEWRILADIARAAGAPLFGNRAADLAARAALRAGGPEALALPLLVPALGLRPKKALRDHPHGVDLSHRERPGDFLKRRIGTADKRVALYPREVWARLDELEASLGAPAAALRLISKRERLGHNSWMHDNPRLSTPSHAVHLSEHDATRLGIRDGDPVRLSANGHSMELPAQVNAELSAGVIAVPHGYGHLAGSSWDTAKARGGQNINQLAASGPSSVDPLSGMAWLVGVPVELERVTHQTASEARAEGAE